MRDVQLRDAVLTLVKWERSPGGGVLCLSSRSLGICKGDKTLCEEQVQVVFSGFRVHSCELGGRFKRNCLGKWVSCDPVTILKGQEAEKRLEKELQKGIEAYRIYEEQGLHYLEGCGEEPFFTVAFEFDALTITEKPLPEYILDGEKFSNIEGFLEETARMLTDGLAWTPGRNLDAFNDLLRGGFGRHEYGEPILLKWRHYEKSKKDLGHENILRIIEIILQCNESGHDVKLELE